MKRGNQHTTSISQEIASKQLNDLPISNLDKPEMSYPSL